MVFRHVPRSLQALVSDFPPLVGLVPFVADVTFQGAVLQPSDGLGAIEETRRFFFRQSGFTGGFIKRNTQAVSVEEEILLASEMNHIGENLGGVINTISDD